MYGFFAEKTTFWYIPRPKMGYIDGILILFFAKDSWKKELYFVKITAISAEN